MSAREYFYSDFLEEGEQIFFVTRRHFSVFLKDIFKIIFVHAVLSVGVWYVFPQLLTLSLIWLGLGAFRMIFVVQDWYFDAWLLTNMGIVEVIWTGYFDRSSSRIEYPSIEGVIYQIRGFWQTMLNFGDVTIAKFGGPSTMTMKDAANPKRVERNILQYQEKFMTRKSYQDQEILKAILADLVVSHVQQHGLPDLVENQQEAVNKE